MFNNETIKNDVKNLKKELANLKSDMEQKIQEQVKNKSKDLVEEAVKKKFISRNLRIIVVIIAFGVAMALIFASLYKSFELLTNSMLRMREVVAVCSITIIVILIIAVLLYSFMELIALWDEK